MRAASPFLISLSFHCLQFSYSLSQGAAGSHCVALPDHRDADFRQARSHCFPVNGRHVQSVMDNSMMSTTKSKHLAGCNWFFYSVKSFYVFSINIFALIGRRR